MIHMPRSLILLIGGLVVAFGVFRIVLGTRKQPADPSGDERKTGNLTGLGRTHNLLVGVIFVVLGVILSLQGFGVKPPWNR